MPQAPAICDNPACGMVFPSGFHFSGDGSAYLTGNKSGPCPNCGAMGSVPDGLYEFVGDTLQIVSKWSPERRQRLAKEIEEAKALPDPRAAAEAVIRREPELLPVAEKLLIPKNAGDFWGFIAAFLAMITLLGGQGGDNVTINEHTVINKVMTQPAPQKPTPSGARPTRSADEKAKAKAKRRATRKARKQGR